MPDDDVIEDGGLEPADDQPVEAPEPEPVEAAEPEVYTREQLAELLPHFDQFASHQGVDAFREYGKSYANAREFISTAQHKQEPDPEPDDTAEDAPMLYGSPWQVPTTWQEVEAYASTDDPNARRLAWVAVAQDPQAPDHIKNAYFEHWAKIDPAGATAYTQQSTMTAAEQRIADLEARLEARYAATHEDLVNRQVASMMETAQSQIPGFVEHSTAVEALFNERAEAEPTFTQRFFAAPMDAQLRELRRLTIIAAAEAAPQRKAAKAQAEAQTDAAKLQQRSETGRTSGVAENDHDALKRQHRESLERVGSRIF